MLAPDSGDTYVLLRVMPHDKAIDWAIKQKTSINTVTRAVEVRDIAMLDELTPAYERIASAPERRLFSKVSDGDLAALGIDETTLPQARALTDAEQLEVFAPYFPQDQREVLEYLAAGFTVEEVWRDVVSVGLAAAPGDDAPVDTEDFATAIHRTRTRIAHVTGSEELRDILDKPFAAWRVFLHPSQHKVAYRASYSGPAQVTGGPGHREDRRRAAPGAASAGLPEGRRAHPAHHLHQRPGGCPADGAGLPRGGRGAARPGGHHDRGRVRGACPVHVAVWDAGEAGELHTVTVVGRNGSPDTPAYRDAAGEFARLYRPDGPTGFIVRPAGHLAARFPLSGTAKDMSGCFATLPGHAG